jgi:hypothetical protein
VEQALLIERDEARHRASAAEPNNQLAVEPAGCDCFLERRQA